MGFRELGLSLLIFIHLINFASSYTIQKTLTPDFMQKSKAEDKIIFGNKIAGGGNGGKAHGNSENGNNDNSGSPNTQGGTAVIPLYVAGASNNNHHHQSHHGGGNCSLNKIKFPTMLIITLVYPLIQLQSLI